MAEVPWHLVLDDIGKRSEALKRKKTNADRIRAMSDEELATWIDHIQSDAYEHGVMETPVVDYPNIYSVWLDWMKQEAEDGKQD